MKNLSLNYVGRLLLSFLALATKGTTILSSSNSSPVWADVFEGTEVCTWWIIGTLGDDIIDSKGGGDDNFGDSILGDGSGNDIIVSAEDDQSTGNGGRDIFVCGGGQDTVTDFNEAEGDIATPDCENT